MTAEKKKKCKKFEEVVAEIQRELSHQAEITTNEYHKEIGDRLGELMKLSPDTLRGYRMLHDANAKTGHLDAKTRELISLAVAVSTLLRRVHRCSY